MTHDPLPMVKCAETHLDQLFRNLIVNALKYRAERKLHIHVSAVQSGANWWFSIRDNGMGIEREYMDQIFGMFKRLHSDQDKGVGVGLAICKRIVERYGCRCWELDALSPVILRERVEAEIVARLDVDSWNHSMKIEAAERESMQGILRVWPSISRQGQKYSEDELP